MRSIRVAVATSLVAVVTLAPTAAHADAYTGYDATKDVSFFPPDDGSGNGGYYRGAPNRAIGDVVRIRGELTSQNLRISQTYRALPAAGKQQLHEFYISTSKQTYLVEVNAYHGHWLGTASLNLRGGSKVNCPNLIKRIDYPAGRVIVQVPRSCLGNPGSVKIRGSIVVFADGGNYEDRALWYNLEKWPFTPGIKA